MMPTWAHWAAEGFHEGAVAEVAAAGGGAAMVKAVGVAGLCEQFFGLGGIVGIALHVGVIAEAAGGDDLAVEAWCRSRRRWCPTCRRGRRSRAWPGARARHSGFRCGRRC